MSYALKNAANVRIRAMIDAEAEFLVARTGDTLDEMRLRQGVVLGLHMAEQAIDDAMRDLGQV